MDKVYIYLIASLLLNLFLITNIETLKNKIKKLEWDNSSKDIQIDNRDRLIEMYWEQCGTLKKIIQTDTDEINRLKKENYELRMDRW